MTDVGDPSKQLPLCSPLHVGTGSAPLCTVTFLQSNMVADVEIDAWGVIPSAPRTAYHPQDKCTQKMLLRPATTGNCLEAPQPEGTYKFTQTVSGLTSSSPPACPVHQPLPANQSAESTADL